MKTKLSLSILLIAAFLLSACGSQPTPIPPTAPPPTAIPPTDTPIPPSPTPVPYDLTITVVDEAGNPIPWANVTLVELNLSATVNESGQASWTNLAQANVTVRVAAQGYAAAEQQLSLNPGPNEQTVTLTRVPYGLLPSQACAPGETLLYAEDFQDGAVENWGVYPPGTVLPFDVDPTAADNKVLMLNFGDTDGEFQVNTIPFQDNIVRRLKYMPGDHSRFHLGYGFGNNTYFATLSADEIVLSYYSDATNMQTLDRGKPVMAQGVWHVLEFSSYNGRIEIWADGTLAVSYDGATAVSEGNVLHIGSAFLPPESIVRIDDISLCGLSAPFVPMPTAAP
ncbi:MAG: carboxypeptidase-like regulatory domain-containing protein [Chloroflexota bacterium]